MKKLQRDIEGDENNIVKLRESEKRELEVSHSIILQSKPLRYEHRKYILKDRERYSGRKHVGVRDIACYLLTSFATC